jgi:hypothetical protein
LKVEPDEPLLDAVKAVITGKSNEGYSCPDRRVRAGLWRSKRMVIPK